MFITVSETQVHNLFSVPHIFLSHLATKPVPVPVISPLVGAIYHLYPKAKANSVMKVQDKNVSSKLNKFIICIIFFK